MTQKDINIFKFLKEALVFKFKHPDKKEFHAIRYDPYIYKWARDTFVRLKLPDYLNISDEHVLEKLYKNLETDPRLKVLNNPDLVQAQSEPELPQELHQQIQQQTQQIGPQAQEAVYGPSSSGVTSFPTSHGSSSPSLRSLFQQRGETAQSMESPQEEAHGNVATATKTAVPDAFNEAFKDEPVESLNPARIPSGPTPVPDAFSKAFENEEEFKTDPTKPAPTHPPTRTKLPPAGKVNFTAPKIPAGISSWGKGFGSKMGVFFQRNAGKFFTFGRVSTLFSAGLGGIIGGGLTGNSLGFMAGLGGGALFPSFIKSGGGKVLAGVGNKAINVGAGISNRAATSSLIKSPSKKIWLGLLMSFLLMTVGLGVFAALLPTPQTTTPGSTSAALGAGCPDTSTNKSSCQYLNPSIGLFNTTISTSDVESYINKYSSVFINSGKGDLAEFRKRANYIVSSSQTAGLNPALFLGYWKSEANFSTVGSRDMGCVGDNFYDQVDCALGINKFSDPAKNPIANCARSRDENSIACSTLKAIRKTHDLAHPVKYPIATIDDFAESYGPYADLVGGVPTNCTHTYNILVEVAKELNSCKASSTIAAVVNGITNTASVITQSLSKGSDGFFNVKKDEAGVYYWCTYLIVDSYNQAGYTGLSRSAHAAVLSMKNFFATTSGFRLLNSQTPVTQLKVGDTVFFEGSGDQHVSLVKSVDLDTQGNGVIKTHESNNIVLEDTIFVKGFRAINAQTTARKYAITGFGQTI